MSITLLTGAMVNSQIIPLSDIDFQFIGMRRSGNHAVIDWILAHTCNWKHYNNAILHGNWTAETTQISTLGDASLSLVNFEDYDIFYLSDHLSSGKKILLLRDPFNLFASRLKWARDFVKNKKSTLTCLDLISCRAVDLWKDYAKEFLSGKYIDINFNRWYSELEYRKNLSDILEMPFTDLGFNSSEGWRFSGGSSFKKADVLNSWKHMENDEEFLAFFDEEMIELSQKIFGPLPKTSPWTQLALQPDLDYRNSVEKIIEASLNYCLQENFDKANELLCQAHKIFPSSTRIAQLTEFLKRDLFASLTMTV